MPYFWKPLGTNMLKMMFWGVWHAISQHEYTNTVHTKIQRMVKCQKTLSSAIFPKALNARMSGIIFWVVNHANTNTQIQGIHKYSKLWNISKPHQIIYVWKALGSRMSVMMLSCLMHSVGCMICTIYTMYKIYTTYKI